MKKIIALLLAVMMVASLAACGTVEPSNTTTNGNVTPTTSKPTTDPQPNKVLTHEEYLATEEGMTVTVEFYVQATQSWWNDKITIYGQTEEGGYYAYETVCSQEDAAKLVPGTKIRVTGERTSWEGEIEVKGGTIEFVEDGDTKIFDAMDVTEYLGTEELVNYQNMKVAFTNMEIKEIEYRNGEPGDDIYVTVMHGGNEYDFCVEVYLTGTESDVYKAFAELKAGDVVDMEGFLYWYQGINPHITAVSAPKTAHEIYVDTPDGEAVSVEFYVQATQSWWSNKITIYGQTEEGGYFSYETVCSEEDAAKLVPGTKIRVTGVKGSWEGELEVMQGTIEFLDAEPYIAEAMDVTALLGTEELVKYQNMLVAFKGITIKEIAYRNGEPGDDIYVTVSYNGADYSFCVERYLTGPETDLYKAFETLQAGDVVDVEGFLYWYQGVNTHITAISKVA